MKLSSSCGSDEKSSLIILSATITLAATEGFRE
jgi:hypothetical protein